MSEDEKQARSRPGRIFSLETLLGAIGLALLVAGLLTGHLMGFFWGSITLAGLILLHRMRKKDWQAHWDEKNRHLPRKKNDR